MNRTWRKRRLDTSENKVIELVNDALGRVGLTELHEDLIMCRAATSTEPLKYQSTWYKIQSREFIIFENVYNFRG